MAAPIAAAARDACFELRSLDAAALRRCSQSFFDTRLLALSPCAAALDALLERINLREGEPGHDADFYA